MKKHNYKQIQFEHLYNRLPPLIFTIITKKLENGKQLYYLIL